MDSAARHHYVSRVSPRQESFNVFAPAAAPISPREHQLLDHFIDILTPVTNPVIYGAADKPVIRKALDDILRCATEDRACKHAVIADAAWHRVGLFKKNNQMIEHNHARVEALYHFTEAFRLLRLKLQDRRERKSESAIIAVRHLGTVSVSSGPSNDPTWDWCR
ncbi:hypothetical protein PV11_02462 [Exophiala sideris]|uniref:Uncharacterized protein n=1 Tax=Exophiala sideris TaxID=1016849 RepID=A0A0D1WDL3_9EURO|nr:hypothetical protein PV11_02462 [Exophiala sideris]